MIDREAFAANMVRILSTMSVSEVRKFLTESRRGYAGTEMEHMMLELIEGHIAFRELNSTSDP